MMLSALIVLVVIESAVIILLVFDRRIWRAQASRVQQESVAKKDTAKASSKGEGFAAKLIRTQDEERQRISRYLHDEVGQQLSLLAIELDLLCGRLATEGYEIEHNELSSRLKRLTDEITSEIHWLSNQLYSARLQHLGLHSAIKELSNQVVKEHRLSINLNITEAILFAPDVALSFFRVIQEALNNVIQHSKAESIWIDIVVADGMAHLRIEDDGSGFDLSVPSSGLGLQVMRERLRMMGGGFVVESTRGEGTIVTASVPLKSNLAGIKPLLSNSAA